MQRPPFQATGNRISIGKQNLGNELIRECDAGIVHVIFDVIVVAQREPLVLDDLPDATRRLRQLRPGAGENEPNVPASRKDCITQTGGTALQPARHRRDRSAWSGRQRRKYPRRGWRCKPLARITCRAASRSFRLDSCWEGPDSAPYRPTIGMQPNKAVLLLSTLFPTPAPG